MNDPQEPLQTIKRIDERQNHVLEDLERLNSRIENLIDVYYQSRPTAGLMPNSPNGEGVQTTTEDAA